MNRARDAILRRLRDANAPAHVPLVPSVTVPARPRRSRQECVERFREELTALGVDFFHEETADAVRARVADFTRGQRTLAWDPEHLPYETSHVVAGATRASAAITEQATATIGVTGCDGAIAETGSLVMLSAPGRSRTVSLLPPVHLAIVRPEDLVFSMGDFFEQRVDAVRRATSCTFITGPSRTADIELTLTLGIHGPGRVIVVVGA
jgi:L-lactate dehydrogenase complex protein LldG